MAAYGNAMESFERAIMINPDPLYAFHQEDMTLKKRLFV
jgi:hypothetical protein